MVARQLISLPEKVSTAPTAGRRRVWYSGSYQLEILCRTRHMPAGSLQASRPPSSLRRKQ